MRADCHVECHRCVPCGRPNQVGIDEPLNGGVSASTRYSFSSAPESI
jgi:hypothetical protein